jgi:hypothetical protein
MSTQDAPFLMRLHIEAMVPLAIHDLHKVGGPTDWHLEHARKLAWDIAECGDILIYKSDKKGETANMMNKLVEGLTILVFQPGGITFLGVHFEVEEDK